MPDQGLPTGGSTTPVTPALQPYMDIMSVGLPRLLARYGSPASWSNPQPYSIGQWGLPTYGGFQFTGAAHEFGGNPDLASIFQQGGQTPEQLAQFLIQAYFARQAYMTSPEAQANIAAGRDVWGNPMPVAGSNGLTRGWAPGTGPSGSTGAQTGQTGSQTPTGAGGGGNTAPAPSTGGGGANPAPASITAPGDTLGGWGGSAGHPGTTMQPNTSSGFDSIIQELARQWNGQGPLPPQSGQGPLPPGEEDQNKTSAGGGSTGFTNKDSFY